MKVTAAEQTRIAMKALIAARAEAQEAQEAAEALRWAREAERQARGLAARLRAALREH